MRPDALLRWPLSLALIALAVLCTSMATRIARAHLETLQDYEHAVLPAAMEIPVLERRTAVLKAQLEASDVERALSGGVTEERLRAFVIPRDISNERILGFLDAVASVLQEEGTVAGTDPVRIGAAIDRSSPVDGTQLVPVTVRYRVTPDNIHALLTALSLAGPLTVGDALDRRDVALLLALSEQENPVAITNLEQFFDTDLLHYARQQRSTEDQVLKSFTSPTFAAALAAAVQTDRMQDVRRLLAGPLGERLQSQQLWPVPALLFDRIERVRQSDGTFTVDITLLALVRGEPGA